MTACTKCFCTFLLPDSSASIIQNTLKMLTPLLSLMCLSIAKAWYIHLKISKIWLITHNFSNVSCISGHTSSLKYFSGTLPPKNWMFQFHRHLNDWKTFTYVSSLSVSHFEEFFYTYIVLSIFVIESQRVLKKSKGSSEYFILIKKKGLKENEENLTSKLVLFKVSEDTGISLTFLSLFLQFYLYLSLPMWLAREKLLILRLGIYKLVNEISLNIWKTLYKLFI